MCIRDSDDSGLAAGVNDVFRQSGIALGVAALGAVFPAVSVLNGGQPAAYVDALGNALWISAAIAALGAVVVIVAMRSARASVDAVGSVDPAQTANIVAMPVVHSKSPFFRHSGPQV